MKDTHVHCRRESRKGSLKNRSLILSARIAVLLVWLCAAGLYADTPAYTGSPRTIAHDFLDLEKDFGAADRHHAEVNRLINLARSLIKTREHYSTEEAVGVLSAIHTLLKQEGYIFKNNLLLGKGLEKKIIDCDNYCALYTAIAEVMRIPMIPVYAPNHSFMRFSFGDGTYLNWETTEGKPRQDAYYISTLRIAEDSIKQGVYMKDLSRKEFIGVEYNNIGAWLMGAKRYREAVPYFTMALKFYPNFSSAWHNRGTCYYGWGRSDAALPDLLYAVKLDPGSAVSHNSIGDIYFDRKAYDNALKHYTASVRTDPTNYVPYHSIGLIMRIKGDEARARQWFGKSAEVKKKYGK
ncbi:MAG TPA: tetratricopeptide repeat protein [Spirochaetes bacterium]|nr:tetratricopeptide repeat protein [Spirochaetota bacterium]